MVEAINRLVLTNQAPGLKGGFAIVCIPRMPGVVIDDTLKNERA